MSSLSLLQQIFLTQESNWGLLHCRQTLYQLSYKGNPCAPARLPGGTLHNSGPAECEYWFLSDLKYVLEYVALSILGTMYSILTVQHLVTVKSYGRNNRSDIALHCI